MKKQFVFWIALFAALILSGCANRDCLRTQVNSCFLHETWLQQINLDSSKWTRCADSWFKTGMPNCTERYANMAPPSSAITTMSIKVPNFTGINVNGTFQVQIVGGQMRNSVYIVGPNVETRQVSVEMHGSTLYLSQTKKCNLNNVIVRIGIRNLRSLCNRACSRIEGKMINSDQLMIGSSGSGSILLSGQMNLTKVSQTGKGSVVIIGVCSPSLCVYAYGNGCVSICGRVGVKIIANHGGGTVNILGADTDSLVITASDRGLTNVVGYANLKKVTARDYSKVYLYWVNSCNTIVCACQHARIGLAGNAKNLNIDIQGYSQFAGQYLHGGNVYVRTRGCSHANVAADQKIFAAALDTSSIYFFGSPNIVSRYVSQNGIVIPVWYDCALPPVPTSRMMGCGSAFYAPLRTCNTGCAAMPCRPRYK